MRRFASGLRVVVGRSVLALAGFALAAGAAASAVRPQALRAEAMPEPLAIDTATPRLSWQLASTRPDAAQSAYRLRVRDAHGATVWDSGRVASRAQAVVYAGRTLGSRERLRWQVRVWDERGAGSRYSAVARFEIGLLHAQDWRARWIAHRDPDAQTLPLIARDFVLPQPVAQARLYAVGLGVFEARLNGRKLGDAVLEPANTDTRKRIATSSYDVTALLRPGANTLGFLLGNGIHHLPPTPGRYQKFARSQGRPMLVAQLEVRLRDGSTLTIASDEHWKTAAGPITFSGWYGGEDHDARAEPRGWDRPGFDRSAWAAARPVEGPGGALHAQVAPPIRVQEVLTAVSRTQVAEGVWLYDLGRNVAGWPQITVRGARGQTAKLVPGEKLLDGRVTQAESGGPMHYAYTAASDAAETWHPRFAYTGFRYLEISGLATPPRAAEVKAQVLRADAPRLGRFTSSDASLNALHELVVRAVESNLMSVMTDCPHREKLGWLEETHLLHDTLAANFDVQAATRQWLRTIAEAQQPNGMVPSIAPEYEVFEGGFRDDVNWGGAIVLLADKAYGAYGDLALLREHYPAMQRYMGYLAGKADAQGLIDDGLGDWGAVDRSTPRAIPATTGWYRITRAMQRIAAVLGDTGSAAAHERQAQAIAHAFHAAYFDASLGRYGTSQASNALPLAAGLVPAEARARVLAALDASLAASGMHVSTGEIGLRALLDVLGDAGRADQVLDLALNPTPPSYRAMLDAGATTLWEYWDGKGSHNHFMLGAIDDWLFRYLAGIRVVEPGFRTFTVAPLVPRRLDHVQASWPTAFGAITSRWRRDARARRFVLDVTVPAGTSATVAVPLLGAPQVRAPRGSVALGTNDGRARYAVGSGRWSFRVDGIAPP